MRLVFFMFFFQSIAFAQVRNLYPHDGAPLIFSAAGETAFNAKQAKCAILFKKAEDGNVASLSADDQRLYKECVENEDGEEGYYDAEGPGCSWYCGGTVDSTFASSELKPFKDTTYSSSNAHDLNYKTAWVEGAPGPGVGQYIVYFFRPSNPRITQIKIANGYVKNEKAWKENGRVKKLKMYWNDKVYAILNLSDSRTLQLFDVPPIGYDRTKVPVSDKGPKWTLKFEILEVYKGDKYEDAAISEIFFDGIDVH